MNSYNNLIIEQKIDEILFNFSNSGDYIAMGLIESRYKIVSEKAKQQLLCLIQEERLNELEITMDKWNDTDFDGFIKYASERSEALKQLKEGTK